VCGKRYAAVKLFDIAHFKTIGYNGDPEWWLSWFSIHAGLVNGVSSHNSPCNRRDMYQSYAFIVWTLIVCVRKYAKHAMHANILLVLL